MPTTRSGQSKSKPAEEATPSTSTDWSIKTPTETATESSTTRSTMTQRSPQRPVGGVSPSHQREDTVPATARTEGGVSPAQRAMGDNANAMQGGRGDIRHQTTSDASRPAPQPTTPRQQGDLISRIEELEQRRAARLEEGGRFATPAPVDARPAPRPSKMDTRSVQSSRKRAEAEARREVARRELEVAEARSRVAQADLILVRLESEEEEDEAREEEQRHRNVEEWLDRSNPALMPPPVSTQPNNEPPSMQPRAPPLSSAPPKTAPHTEAKQKKKSDIEKLAEAITSIAQRPAEDILTKQIVELPFFNGACEEWLAFRRSYIDTAHSFTPAQNLARLRKSLQGRAREAVKNLLFTAADPAEVLKGLETRFGRPGALALSELEKMKSLPRVSENPSEVCAFASSVRNSVATIRAVGKEQYLCSPETAKALIEKMPSSMKFRWYAYHRGRRDDGCQELALINEFLEIEADMCGDFAPPEVSWEKKPRHQPPEAHWENRKPATRKPVHVVQDREVPKGATCPLCEESHWLFECKKFKEADVDARWELAKKARICFKCLRFRHSRPTCKAPTCRKCSRWHHISLHSEKIPAVAATVRKETRCHTLRADEENEEPVEEVVSSVHTSSGGRAYLKMVPVNLYGPKASIRVLALLDEGSTVTLLDSSVAKQIGAEGRTEALTIETVGGKGFKKDNSQLVKLKIKGAHRRDKKVIEVRTIDGLRLAKQGVNEELVKKCEHLKKIKDQLVYEKEEPRLLIGQDNWGLIVTRRLKKGKPSDPVASLTGLGWVLHGCDEGNNVPVKFVNHCIVKEDETEALVRRHFEIESIGVQPRRPSNDADQRALDVLKRTTRRLPNGKFESGLLWKSENEELPDNYQQAYRRLVNIEKKLDKDEDLKKAYESQMENLMVNGYAEKAPTNTTQGRTFYLPHFAVVHPVKKKPRIVLDAAAKFNGKSLNDALLPGPDLLQSLFGVLIRFREKPIAVVADIKEMFLRIQMREADRDSLRFLWRGDRRSGKPEEYRMASVVFGATSSPSTAIYVMNKNAEDFKEEYPAAVKAIEKNHYMDDYLQSFSTVEEARRVAGEVQHIHAKAGFHLRGWGSNRQEVLQDLQDQLEEKVVDLTKEEKTLGLRWLIGEDALAFNVGLRNTPPEILNGEQTPTKREVTSAVMSTFDPMGFAAPVLIQGKKLIQDIWRAKIGWDEKIPEEQEAVWRKYLKEIAILKELKIPRCLSPKTEEGQLHTFTDASEEAYSAAVYWRTVEPDGKIRVTLIAGKARVSPTKPVSIPRLELQAALLGSRLATTVEKELGLKIESKTFWTDSSTVLQWLKADPRKFKTFVAHRLAEIEELTRPQDWRWVPTKQNPADDATRGTPNEFDGNARWIKGPSFLYEDEKEWPTRKFEVKTIGTEEMKNAQIVAALGQKEIYVPDPARFSKWTRLVRATARVIQFIEELKKRRNQKNQVNALRDEVWKPHKRRSKKANPPPPPLKLGKEISLIPLEEEHLVRAEEELIKLSQEESFERELTRLREGKPLENSSRLRKIDVYLDRRGIIKLRSRAKKIYIENREKNPVVLEGKNRICRLIIESYHERFMHGNVATVINELRQKYWIIGLRTTARRLVHECQWCKVYKSAPQIPPTGDLPIERLHHHQFPFTSTAVDYFGPMQVTIGRRSEKRWGVLFTCLTTRAVHLELASSLSTSSMIMALRRMAARRGMPKVLFSDNGTNFVGAQKELEEAADKEGITWKFIPPGCPSMGGAWERLVRSVKTALMVVLQSRTPPEEVLHTLLTEVEHVVNSRPLTHISVDPNDEESLTPNHFLLGRSCGAASPGDFSDHELVGKANWRTAQRLTDHFWQRWVKEYLPTLMPRKITGRDSTDPQVGDIVLIADGSLPRNTWPRGEVHEVYPGPDGRVRVLDVRTPWGVLRRPTRRIIVLVPAASPPQDGVLRTGGETVSDA